MKHPTAESYYEKVALKLVPSGGHVSKPVLRTRIAEALEKEVANALARQLEKEFPDLERKRTELDELKTRLLKEEEDRKQHYSKRERELASSEAGLKQRELVLQQREDALNHLVLAFAEYMDWLDGKGEVDENGKRFKSLTEAYQKYKGRNG